MAQSEFLKSQAVIDSSLADLREKERVVISDLEVKELAAVAANDGLVTVKTQLYELQQALDQTNLEYNNAKGELEAQTAQRDSLIQQLPELQRQADEHYNRKVALESEIEKLEAGKKDRLFRLEELENVFGEKKQKYERQLADLKASSIALVDERRNFELEAEITRKELAKRAIEQQKQADNLKIRERKADILEDKVRQNAGLLDL